MISLATPALATAQLEAALARLDAGAGNARMRVFSTLTPPEASDTPMCELTLPKPCGAVSGAQLTLAAPDAALVMVAGLPRWAVLVAGDGVALHVGDVTDDAGDGFYKVTGADTPPGETSPYFAAGGLLSMGSVVYS